MADQEVLENGAPVLYESKTPIVMSAHGITRSINEIMLEAEKSGVVPDIISAKGMVEMFGRQIDPKKDIIVINDPALAQQIFSKKNTYSNKVRRYMPGTNVIANSGPKGNVSGAEGEEHAKLRDIVEGYYTRPKIEALKESYRAIIEAEFANEEEMLIDEKFLINLSNKLTLVSVGEDPNNQKALEALERLFDLSYERLTFEIKNVAMLRVPQKLILKDKFAPKTGRKAQIAIEEFYAAIGSGTPGSLFHENMNNPEFPREGFVSALTLGGNSLHTVMKEALFEAFSNNGELADLVDGVEAKHRVTTLMRFLIEKYKAPSTFISREYYSNDVLNGKDGKPIVTSDGEVIQPKEGTTFVYHIQRAFDVTGDPSVIFGAGPQVCLAQFMAPLTTFLAYEVARSTGFQVVPGGSVGIEQEKHAPLLKGRGGFKIVR